MINTATRSSEWAALMPNWPISRCAEPWWVDVSNLWKLTGKMYRVWWLSIIRDTSGLRHVVWHELETKTFSTFPLPPHLLDLCQCVVQSGDLRYWLKFSQLHSGSVLWSSPNLPFSHPTQIEYHQTMPDWSDPREISKDGGECTLCFVCCHTSDILHFLRIPEWLHSPFIFALISTSWLGESHWYTVEIFMKLNLALLGAFTWEIFVQLPFDWSIISRKVRLSFLSPLIRQVIV